VTGTGRLESVSLAGDFDVFIDLSVNNLEDEQIAEHIGLLRQQSGLVIEGRRITVALPFGRTPNQPDLCFPPVCPGKAFAGALCTAGASRRGMLLVQGAWIPGNEAVLALAAYQDADPMIGTVQPRFATAGSDRIVGLPGTEPSTEVMLPRTALPYLPETVIIPELSAPLLLITPRAVLAADVIGTDRFGATLTALLICLRRRGFRGMVCNRVVIAYPFDATLVYPPSTFAEGQDDHLWCQDAVRARDWLTAMPERGLEAILAGGIRSDGRAKVLLDCRGMHDFCNGTTHAILGYLDGIAELATPRLEITVLTTAAAARFHELDARYSHFRIQLDRPEGYFLVAIRLDQPWHLDTIMELHAHALFIVFNILDTITWDINLISAQEFDRCCRLLARLADAFLFISNYTRDRFLFRFKPDRSIPLIVTHLSLDRWELVRGPVGAAPFEEPYILIFGNNYDHKGLEPTLATLTDAFPYTRIVVIGTELARSPRVTVLQCGRIREIEINTLLGSAAVVVFPSYYEGFGLPVVHGLAHGRIVVVRNSPFWNEISAHADLPGTLVPFDDDNGLVEGVGRALHGAPVAGLALGSAITDGHSAPRWRDCAQHVLDLVGDLTFERNGSRWLERQIILGRVDHSAG
jgi:glycosyltransferase involved in cell wall biosynthesis